MSDNSYEYTIKQRTEGKVLMQKLLLLFSYGAFAIALFSLVLAFSPVDLFLPLLLLAAVLTLLLIFITWRFTCVEYEIILSGGDLTVTLLYGKRRSKTLFSLAVNSIYEIGEYDDHAYEEISKLSLQKDYICLSSLSAPSVYYALFEEEDEQCIFYFDAPEGAIALLRKWNSGAFRAGKHRISGDLPGERN